MLTMSGRVFQILDGCARRTHNRRCRETACSCETVNSRGHTIAILFPATALLSAVALWDCQFLLADWNSELYPCCPGKVVLRAPTVQGVLFPKRIVAKEGHRERGV